MSRIGKQPITIPSKVNVTLGDQEVVAQGPKGKLSLKLPPLTSVTINGDKVVVSRSEDTSQGKAMHGLARALINNLVTGVSVGFQEKLEIQGVGFKASVQGDVINLLLGFSHPINYKLPNDIKVTVEDSTKITIDGIDKQVVGKVAAEIRSYYPPEPYKGKGVRYLGEKVIRKEGKTVQ